MRSHVRRSLAAEIRAEIVKRFEEVVTTEIRNHNVAIQSYQKDLQELSTSFKKILVEQEALKQETAKTYLISQTNFLCEMTRLENDFEDQRRHIKESKVLLENNLLDFNQRLSNSISVKFFENFSRQLNDRFDLLDRKIEMGKRYSDENLYSLRIEIKKYHLELVEHNKKITESFENSLSKISEDLGIYKIDAQGITRDINVFKKDLFIIEKKIEHIYGLLNRNKEGGKFCHNQV